MTAQHTPQKLFTRTSPFRGVSQRWSDDGASAPQRADARSPLAASSGSFPVLDLPSELPLPTEAVLMLDRSGRVQYADDACEVLLGSASLQEQHMSMLGGPFDEITALELRELVKELHCTGVWRGTLHFRGVSPARPLDVSVRAVPSVTGVIGYAARIQTFCVILRPLRAHAAHATPVSVSHHAPTSSNHASVERALSVASRVASEVAHDLNNQLSVVLNYSYILLRELPEESSLREHVGDMQSAAWRASEVAREMLRYGQKRMPEPVDLDVNQVIQDAHVLLEHMLTATAPVERRLADSLWLVHARRSHLEWLLIELTMRLRARLGPLECLRITTCNASRRQASGMARHVAIYLDGYVSSTRRAYERNLELPPPDTQRLTQPSEPSTGTRSMELALAHAEAELTMQALPDDAGLRYLIYLPAA